MRFRKHVEGDKNRMLFRECIYPVAVPGYVNRSEREKGTREIIAECQMDPCRTSSTPRGTSYYSFASISPDEFVSPALELETPRVK
jgi:hypothetical protein